MKELEKIRDEINMIDEEMVKLFEKRMNLVSHVIDYKIKNNMEILDSNREKIVVSKNLKFLKDENLENYYIEFIKNLMDISKKYQKDILKK